jgi:methyl-accepting chemotaxis protein
VIRLQASYNPLLDANGKRFKVVKFASDITAVESQTRKLEAKIAAINRSQGVIEFNLDGTVITANSNFLAVVGYTAAEVVGKHHRIFVDSNYANSNEYRLFWDRLNRGEYVADKFRRISKSGKDVWIQASYNPLLDANGKPFKVVKFASDVTAVEDERRHTEEDRTAKSEQQAHVVDSLGSGLRQLSDVPHRRGISTGIRTTSLGLQCRNEQVAGDTQGCKRKRRCRSFRRIGTGGRLRRSLPPHRAAGRLA